MATPSSNPAPSRQIPPLKLMVPTRPTLSQTKSKVPLRHSHTQLGETSIHSMNSTASYVILDNQYTVDVFSNTSLLTNIHQSWSTLQLSYNSGTVPITLVGDLQWYGTVWYHPKGTTDILSIARLKNIYRVTYNSMKGDFFTVHKEKIFTRQLLDYHQGLY